MFLVEFPQVFLASLELFLVFLVEFPQVLLVFLEVLLQPEVLLQLEYLIQLEYLLQLGVRHGKEFLGGRAYGQQLADALVAQTGDKGKCYVVRIQDAVFSLCVMI